MKKYLDVDYSNAELIAAVNDAIHSRRDRAMICAWLVDGDSQESIAEAFDLSISQTKRILTRTRERVFRCMKLI